jgi:hypothetical protein
MGKSMPSLLLAFFEVSRTANSMTGALLVMLVIGVLAAKNNIAAAHGLDKIAALTNLCFAIPLGVFGAEHLSAANGLSNGVPAFVPWHLFWAYVVGFALIAASLSIATNIQVQWSGLLFGIMMLLFEAMLHIPGALASHPPDRIRWTVVAREFSFAGGGFVLAGIAMGGLRGRGRALITIGRVLIAITAIAFAVEQLLHPFGMPAVPLEKEMPAWIGLHLHNGHEMPAWFGVRPIIGYVTGAMLLLCGMSILLAQKVHEAATYLGGWILLLVLCVYGPVMIAGLIDPSTSVKVEGLNYFADTLLFGAVILALAKATQPSASQSLR